MLKCFGWRAQRVFTQGVVVHSGILAFSLKEFLQQLPALLGQNTPSQLCLVVEPPVTQQIDDRAGRAGLGVWCSEHHPF